MINGVVQAADALDDSDKDLLHSMLCEFSDVFRCGLDGSPPMDVPPMTVELLPEARSVRCFAGRYAPLARQFLLTTAEKLERFGCIYPNPSTPFASRANATPKASDPGNYRLTVDLRQINAITKPYHWPALDVESISTRLAASVVFSSLDADNGYWQIPLDPSAQHIFSIMMPHGVFSSTRSLQGSINGTAWFQSAMHYVFGSLMEKTAEVNIDDLLIHSPNNSQHFSTLRELFVLARRHRVRLAIHKCNFFRRETKFCGKLYSAAGIRHDPARLMGISALPLPSTAADLMQFLCSLNWLRKSIMCYSSLVAPLQKLLDECLAKTTRRSSNQACKISLTELWNEEHSHAWARIRDVLCRSVQLSHLKDSYTVNFFSDASDAAWAVVVTQTPPGQDTTSIIDRDHEPLAFVSSVFKGSQVRWPTVEKEAYAVVEGIARLEYLLYRERGFQLYTDHHNLTYIFRPQSFGVSKRSSLDRLARWSIRLSSIPHCTIRFIKGSDNVWADLLTRWGSPWLSSKRCPTIATERVDPVSVEYSVRRISVSSSFLPNMSVHSASVSWPCFSDLLASQSQHRHSAPSDLTPDEDGLLRNQNSAVWIPAVDEYLILRLCVIGHMGIGGHRGFESTFSVISSRFVWVAMRERIRGFINQCLHCLSCKGPVRIPRPLGEAIHADRPNAVLHFDYLFIRQPGRQATHDFRYVLVFMDDHSSFVQLAPSSQATTDQVVSSILRWGAAYGFPRIWVSDQGTHFKNTVMAELSSRLRVQHHFTIAGMHFPNGTVERVCQVVQEVFRLLINDMGLDEHEWPTLLPLVE
jgi:hypothetical protein